MINIIQEFRIKRLQAKGQIMLKKGNFEKAYEYFSKVVLLRNSAENHFNLSVALLSLQKYAEAEKQLQIVVQNKQFSNNELVILSLAQCQFMQKNFEDAIENYEKLIKLKPENKNYAHYLKRCLDIENREKYVKAREFFDQAQKIIPKHKFSQAYELMLKAIKNDPSQAVYYNNLGSLAIQIKRSKTEIIGYFEKAVELDPKNQQFLQNLAYIKQKLK